MEVLFGSVCLPPQLWDLIFAGNERKQAEIKGVKQKRKGK